MPAILSLSALFVGFVACSRFLLGQLFFGVFSFAETLTGMAGLICAVVALKMSSQWNWAPAGVYWACFIALAGVAMDIASHYTQSQAPGNYYAWSVIGPYTACLVLFAYVASRRRAASRTDA